MPADIDSGFNIGNYVKTVDKKVSRIERKLSSRSEKYLKIFSREEQRLNGMINKLDPVKSKERAMSVMLNFDLTSTNVYVPILDSFRTGFKFLDENRMFFNEAIDSEGFRKAFEQVNNLQASINRSEGAIKYFDKRREHLYLSLRKFGLEKKIKRYTKHYRYYQSYVEEYRNVLSEPDKVLLTATQRLQRLPAFQKFFARNSELASFFRLSEGRTVNEKLLDGLQTRDKVMESVKQRLGSSTSGGEQLLQQKLLDGQNQLGNNKSIASKIRPIAPGGAPEYEINSQKSKSVLKRLKLGMDFQTTQRSGIFPVTSDIALSVGYAITDKIVAGVGLSGKLGWGTGFNNMSITWQGVGLRSYFDIKTVRTLYITGGVEANYRTEINKYSQLKDFSAWQSSALIGAGKTIPLKNKFMKTAKFSVLWDVLSYKQVPRTQPFLFRFGYHFN